MRNGIKLLVAIALSCTLFTLSTPADTITATHTGAAYGSVNMNWNLMGTNPTQSGQSSVGLFKMRLDEDNFGQILLPEPTGVGSYFHAFCIELTQTLTSPVVYDVVELPEGRDPSPIQQDRASLVASVLGAANYINFGNTLPNAVTSAAIQVAIWEVVYEALAVEPFTTAFDVRTGDAYFGSGQGGTTVQSVLNLAQGYLDAIGTATPAENLFALNSTRTPGSQDLLVQIFTAGSTEPIPEPGTLALLGIGLLALGLMRRVATR